MIPNLKTRVRLLVITNIAIFSFVVSSLGFINPMFPIGLTIGMFVGVFLISDIEI